MEIPRQKRIENLAIRKVFNTWLAVLAIGLAREYGDPPSSGPGHEPGPIYVGPTLQHTQQPKICPFDNLNTTASDKDCVPEVPASAPTDVIMHNTVVLY